jgi:hypothetical protein
MLALTCRACVMRHDLYQGLIVLTPRPPSLAGVPKARPERFGGGRFYAESSGLGGPGG